MVVLIIFTSILQMTCIHTEELHKHKSQPKGLCPKPDFLWVPGSSRVGFQLIVNLPRKQAMGTKGLPQTMITTLEALKPSCSGVLFGGWKARQGLPIPQD